MKTQNEVKHTPTPWARTAYGVFAETRKVADCQPDDGRGTYRIESEEEAVADADFIVRAVNSHDALITALRDMLALGLDVEEAKVTMKEIVHRRNKAFDAIKQAEGK